MSFIDRACTWKDRPCHFTWKLDVGDRVNYKKLVEEIDCDLETTRNLLTVGNLLFRAYLEVSNCHDGKVSKARKFLNRADHYIVNRAPSDFRNGYKSVALLNRMWIEQKILNARNVESLLAELNQLDLTEKDACVINTVKASGLIRLGPREIDFALELFEAGLKYFPKCPDFLFGAVLMTGRKLRYERKPGAIHYKELDKDGQYLMNKQKTYCKKLMKGEDEYQLGRSFLGQNLKKRGKRFHTEACEHLEGAFQQAPLVRATFKNLIRYYRYNDVEKAIAVLNDNIHKRHYMSLAEGHFQLALCYIRKRNLIGHQWSITRNEMNRKALEELETCLELDKLHLFALTKKLDLMTECGQFKAARKLYEDKLHRSDDLILPDRFHLYYSYAKFLDIADASVVTDTIWQRVMEISKQFEYQDKITGKWNLLNKIKTGRDYACKQLFTYYNQMNEECYLQRGILYLRKFKFEKAERNLVRLDSKSNVEIPMYLAEIHFKWGCELEVRSNLGQCQPDEAAGRFIMARENVVTASKMRDFDDTRGRRLLADIAVWTAHNRLTLETRQSQSDPPDSVKEPCIDAYREAIRCGSLVASSELLRLIQKGHLKTISRSLSIRILAEIDFCCSRDARDYLHTEYKPLSFVGGLTSRDTDSDQMGMDCDTIKQDIKDILSRDEFYSDAWKEYFDMEKKILQEDLQSTSITLRLSEEGGTSVVKWSDDAVKAAVDCGEKARPLLDHIIMKFQMEELKFSQEKRKQYFPLMKKERDRTKLEKELKRPLKETFEVDLKTHYPKLYAYILQIQPCINPEYECLLSLCDVVCHSKHVSRKSKNLLSLAEDPVKVARQSMDKVEEICNFFLDTMKDSSELDNKVKELVSDLRSGSHEKADQLLKILTENDDFVCRIRSTWTFLEMLALVQRSNNQSGLGDPDGEVIKLAEGTWDLSKKLRRSHLAVEVAQLESADPCSNEVVEKCRNTCKEGDDLLNTVMETMKKNPQDGKAVKFPFKDLHPQGSDQGWEGKVIHQLRPEIKHMGIIQVKDNLTTIVLKLQPCTNEENYKFLAMRQFAQNCDGVDTLKDTVSIQTDVPDTREYKVLDLVRWCIDNVEKIAGEIYELVPQVCKGKLPLEAAIASASASLCNDSVLVSATSGLAE